MARCGDEGKAARKNSEMMTPPLQRVAKEPTVLSESCGNSAEASIENE